LLQVLVNLIINSCDAMTSLNDGARKLRVQSQRFREGNSVQVSVIDSGIGIDPKDVDLIFNAFFTTKPKGMGLGLSISRSIIEGHGGRIWAMSNDGQGLTVTFTLPVEGAVRA